MENNTIGNNHKIDLDDIESGMRTTNESYDFENQAKLSHWENLELRSRKEFLDMRKTWSRWIIAWITGIIVFHIVLVCLIGCDILEYKDNGWLLVATIVEGLLEIFGMGFIIVKFLFDGRSNDKRCGR
jgi:hypothetical protein